MCERERESGGVSVTYWIVGVWDSCYTIMSLAVMMEAGGWLVAWGTTSRKEAFTSLRNTDKFFVNLQVRRRRDSITCKMEPSYSHVSVPGLQVAFYSVHQVIKTLHHCTLAVHWLHGNHTLPEALEVLVEGERER